jgi:hypothetical protein
MHTGALASLLDFFSPIWPSARKQEQEAILGDEEELKDYTKAVLPLFRFVAHIFIGSLTFALLLIPSIALQVLTENLPAVERSATRYSVYALVGIDVLLFIIFLLRSLIRAIAEEFSLWPFKK